MQDRIEHICDLLLGAAFADDEFHEREKAQIHELLSKLLGEAGLPGELSQRIEDFEPKSFSLAACAKRFAGDPEADRLKLMELVGAVHEADDEFSFAEDEYLRELGVLLGLESARVESLAFDFEVGGLQESFEVLCAPGRRD